MEIYTRLYAVNVQGFVFFSPILAELQFRLAIVLNTGEVVVNSKAIALNYLRGWFALDVITVLPLPQVHSMLTYLLVLFIS
jgi:hypothetical protein